MAQFLHKAGIYVSAVNPCLIRDYGNNSLRRVKTDKKDALKIARYGLDNWHELPEYSPLEITRQQLKNMSRQLALYTKTKVSLKNNLIALLDQTWPGVNTFFDSPVRADGHQKWIDFAAAFWHADCVNCLSEAVFIERYRKWCIRHKYQFSLSKANQLYINSFEQVTVLPKNPNTKTLIQAAAAALNSISLTTETFRSQILLLAQLLPEYPVVMDMYGVGDTIGPQLMAEIGDVRRFSHRGSLIAFAGVDPQPSQSGKQVSRRSPISRKGSAALRKSLYQVMTTHLLKSPPDEPVYQFIDRKRSEGKPYYVYMTAGCNKFLRIYYARVNEYLAALDA